MFKNLVSFYQKQALSAHNMWLVIDANKNYYQNCHGDFAYYPDTLTMYDAEKADERNEGRLTGIRDIENLIAA